MKVPFLKLIVRKIRKSIAIVEEGDTVTHSGGLAVGKYVIWKGTQYKVTTAMSYGETISGSKLSAVSDGIANELNGNKVTNGSIADLEAIELGHGATGHGGYIDFHYNGDTSVDYTSRISERNSGEIFINGVSILGLNNRLSGMTVYKAQSGGGASVVFSNLRIGYRYTALFIGNGNGSPCLASCCLCSSGGAIQTDCNISSPYTISQSDNGNGTMNVTIGNVPIWGFYWLLTFA